MNNDTIESEPPKWLQKLAIEIDSASDTGDEARLLHLVQRAEQLATSNEAHRPELLYFASNAYSALDAVKRQDPSIAWQWERPEATSTILSLRAAKADKEFSRLNPVRQCQVLTNLGNALNQVGRPVEAIESWDQALSLIPVFAMALGNRADGLVYFANALHDGGHRGCLWSEAKTGFDRALDERAFWDSGSQPDVAEAFRTRRDYLSEVVQPDWAISSFAQGEENLGLTYEEKSYRKWRLGERLFLNPLNDLGPWPLAARDVYHLPNHTYGLQERPRFVRYFDLMKQEYVAACALFFEGKPEDIEEYSDREVLLYEHADYEVFGLRLEKQKASYRMAYSVLDKIAGFINDYFGLGRDEKKLSFRNVWYDQPKGQPRTLDPRLIEIRNWPLRGLHAVSKDIFDIGFQDVADPEAKQLSETRNAMEHRFLSVHGFGNAASDGGAHTSISYDDFVRRASRLLKTVRAALTYLSMAMHAEERRRSENRTDEKLIVDFPSMTRRGPSLW